MGGVMTEYKQLKEQIAHRYRYHQPAGEGNTNARATRPVNRGRRAAASPTDAHARRRVVRNPDAIVQPTPWAERRAQQRNASVESHAHTRCVQRSLPKTGAGGPTFASL